jgi:hypothetical protein
MLFTGFSVYIYTKQNKNVVFIPQRTIPTDGHHSSVKLVPNLAGIGVRCS